MAPSSATVTRISARPDETASSAPPLIDQDDIGLHADSLHCRAGQIDFVPFAVVSCNDQLGCDVIRLPRLDIDGSKTVGQVRSIDGDFQNIQDCAVASLGGSSAVHSGRSPAQAVKIGEAEIGSGPRCGRRYG